MTGSDSNASTPDQNGSAPRARYVFAVEFRVRPTDAAYALSPDTFESTLTRRAPPPGEEGWLFFHDHLWRGSLSDREHFRRRIRETLGVPVESVAFRELRTDEAYLDALRSAIADDLARFRTDSVDRALTNYLGSSIHVVEDP